MRGACAASRVALCLIGLSALVVCGACVVRRLGTAGASRDGRPLGEVRPANGTAPTSAWPTFHQNARHTGLSPYVGPHGASVAWTYDVGGAVAGIALGNEGTLYVTSATRPVLTALDPGGGLAWELDTGRPSWGPPGVAADGSVYVATWEKAFPEAGELCGVAPDGTLKWRVDLGSTIPGGPTPAPDGRVYVATYSGALFAVSSVAAVEWHISTGWRGGGAPTLDPQGRLLVGGLDHEPKGGFLTAVGLDGATVWRMETDDWVLNSTAVGKDGTVYATCMDGDVYAVASDGSLRWRFHAGKATGSSPAIGPDGTVYCGTQDRGLVALTERGALRWSFATTGDVFTSPAVGADGVVYFGCSSGHVYAVSPGGEEVWHAAVDGPAQMSPVIGRDGTLYAGSASGKVYAFRRQGAVGGPNAAR